MTKMKSKFINVFMFAAGAAVGSAVTWKIVKTRYERIVQKEIDSVKEVFSEQWGEQNGPSENEDDTEEDRPENNGQINWEELEDLDKSELEDEFDEKDVEEYHRLASNYTNEEGGAKEVFKEPYVISPYDFGELDEYHQVELTYYEGDDTLEDEEYNVVTDRNDLIGPKALFTFGEYEDDSVFVRNERLMTDFQILKDYRSYSEARNSSPGRVDNR